VQNAIQVHKSTLNTTKFVDSVRGRKFQRQKMGPNGNCAYSREQTDWSVEGKNHLLGVATTFFHVPSHSSSSGQPRGKGVGGGCKTEFPTVLPFKARLI
jgi:hypothetical protein